MEWTICPSRKKNKTPQQRFWEKVDKRGPDECWLWTGSINQTGHGVCGMQFRNNYDGRIQQIGAAKVSLIFSNRPQPKGKRHALHTCRQRACVNPSHLYWGDNDDNCRDRVRENTTYTKGAFDYEDVDRIRHQFWPAASAWSRQERQRWIDREAAEWGIEPLFMRRLLMGVTYKKAPSMAVIPATARELICKTLRMSQATHMEMYRRVKFGEAVARVAEDYGVDYYVVYNAFHKFLKKEEELS